MSNVVVNNKTFQPFISSEAIHQRIKEMGKQIDNDFAGKRPLFIAILNGSFMFASDLFKSISIEAEICFIKLASYKGTSSTGNLITSIGLDESLVNRHVVIIEDIIDTGNTLHQFLPQIHNQQPASLKIAALLNKPTAMKYPIVIDYLGFSVPDKFLLGFGLDFDGLGRNFPQIYQLMNE
jgi:hypoxanthine phosphoribosyltransferase